MNLDALTLLGPARLAWTLVLLQACGSNCGKEDRESTAPTTPSAAAEWYEVVSHQPGPQVVDAAMRAKIVDSGLPWKVRDRATHIALVLVMPGDFLMGSPESELGRKANEGPQHRVRLSKAFYLGATEVSQAQWERLMGPLIASSKGMTSPLLPLVLISVFF